ncbi:PTS transporter subunit EIIC [Collinsella sp. AGMB00827]|uniref:PTS transporter subunit EIIC n=1 Tax=Collinsella ureilytica TaxID=2869515 RepID=A0ABS7MJU7_9ACTN|nr:PTS transporter subunit EIIC [Collinsella urealyticum]MBY4797552.1 PTS transporter subunit EIIC [Collinsella urealyticum]
MDYVKTAETLIDLVGGRKNLISNAVCMTRVRIGVKDISQVDMEGLRAVEGVMGVVQAKTIQIVFGPGTVTKVGEAIAELTGLPLGSVEAAEDDLADIAQSNKDDQKTKHDHTLQRGLQHIANVFIPLLPGIIAAGLINGVCNVIDFQTSGALTTHWWYLTIKTIGWGLFTFLPIFVGMNAAREFKGTAILGGIGGAFCLNAAVPGFPLASQAVAMPFTNSFFVAGIGGIITALLMGAFFAALERAIRKVMPNILDTFLTPLITTIVGSLIAVVFLQPVGTALTSGIYLVMDFVYTQLGVFGGYILAAGFLPLVSVGLHQALTPIHALLNNPAGPTEGINYLLPVLMMAGGGQVGAGLALFLRSKNVRFKRLVMSSVPVAILGIGEPLMYAITLPLGRPFITACLGAGIGGVAASILHLGTVSQGVSGLFGLLIVQPGSQISYAIAMLLAYAGGFVLTWIFGYDAKRIEEIYPE